MAGTAGKADSCRGVRAYLDPDCTPASASSTDAESDEVDTTAIAAEVNVVTDFVFVPGQSLELDFYFDPEAITVQRCGTL